MLNDVSSALALLETRRSGRPRDLTAPGPSDEQLERMLTIAARVPDHGGLVPFRFVTVGAGQRDALAGLYRRALGQAEPDAPEPKVAKALANAHAARVRPQHLDEAVRISADLGRHAAWLAEDLELGADRVFVHNVGTNQREALEAFGAQVLPRLA